MPHNPLCSACVLHESARTRCIWGERVGKEAPVMVVGEAPGAKEDIDGRPFLGAAGKLIRSALETAGLKNYYVTNVAKCRPPDNKLPDTKKKLGAILDGCLGYLHEEIAEVKPRFILALGNTPLLALTGFTGVTKYRGTPIQVEFPHGEVTIFPAYHPAYVLRNPGMDKVFRLDLGTFAGLVAGRTGEDFWAPMHNIIVTSKAHLKHIQGVHNESKAIGAVQVYDIENLGYWVGDKYIPTVKRSNYNGPVCSPEEGTIPWLGIAYHHEDGRNTQFIIPWEHPKAGESWRNLVTSTAKLVLEDQECKRVAQYGKSDDRWLYSRGIYPHRTYDTYNAAYMLDENIPHGIETIAKLEVGAPVWGEAFDYSALDTLPFAEVADYLGKDLYATGRTYFEQRKKLAADQGLARVFTHIMMPGDRMLCEIQQHGLWVFEDTLAAKTEKFHLRRSEIYFELHKAYVKALGLETAEAINWNSTPQKQRILFDELGLPIYKVSKKTGLPSTDKDVLARLEEDTGHPVVTALRKYQKIEMLCRFLKRWKTKVDKAKEVRGEPRIYTELNIAKVVTGRLSSNDPDGTGDNLQQVPSRGEGAELRECFGVPSGRKLVEADYSQIELREAAEVADEKNMKRLFAEGKDLHINTAAIVARKGYDDVTKEERKKAKPVNFGFIFDMRAKRFVSYALTEYSEVYTLREAEAVRKDFFRAYPGLLRYYEETRKEVRTTGQVRTFMGRIRRLPDIYSPDEFIQMEAEREAINAKVQSPANDLTLLAAIYLHDYFKKHNWDAKVILLVHDAIMMDVAEEIAEKVAALTKYVMEKVVPQIVQKKFGVTLTVPLEAEVAIGSVWGQCEVWKGVAWL